MQKTTKKIIAREFLYLLGTITVFFIVTLICSWLSERNFQEQNELKTEIQKLTEYQKLPYRLRTFYYINNGINKDPSEKWKKREKFISDMKVKRLALDIYDFMKPKFDPNKLYEVISEKNATEKIDSSKRNFLTQIAKDKESESYLQKIILKEKELEKVKNSVLNKMGTKEAIILGVILLSIFFLLRYLIYATKWSIRQLKE